jgi:hypothetical protein
MDASPLTPLLVMQSRAPLWKVVAVADKRFRLGTKQRRKDRRWKARKKDIDEYNREQRERDKKERQRLRRNEGRAVNQAASRRPLTAEVRVRALGGQCGTFGGQSGAGTGLFPSSSVVPCQHHFTVALHFYI